MNIKELNENQSSERGTVLQKCIKESEIENCDNALIQYTYVKWSDVKEKLKDIPKEEIDERLVNFIFPKEDQEIYITCYFLDIFGQGGGLALADPSGEVSEITDIWIT